nr:DUF3939 domain-containing protein [Neobacillus sp. Marseille-Q6967]
METLSTNIFWGITIVLAAIAGLVLFLKYYKRQPDTKVTAPKANELLTEFSTIDVTAEQVRKAVRQYSDNLPKGVYRTIIVKDDNSIDFSQLVHILGGIPEKKYYMSKETYDLFEEHESKIAIEMDLVQKAVDLYVKERKEFPMLRFDPDRRVNYYQLIQEHYLKTAPETQFYITNLDGLITHIKPEKRKKESSSQ